MKFDFNKIKGYILPVGIAAIFAGINAIGDKKAEDRIDNMDNRIAELEKKNKEEA